MNRINPKQWAATGLSFLGLTALFLTILALAQLLSGCDASAPAVAVADRSHQVCPEGCVCECVDPSSSSDSSGASSGDGASSSDTGVLAGTGSPSPDPLDALDDDFSGDLSLWTVYRPQDAAQLSVSGGALTLAPNPGTAWYQSGESVQLGQQVDGDFMVTATLSVTSSADPWQLVGISLRADGVFPPDTYHVVLGTIGGTSGLQAEWKSTDNGNSLWASVDNPSGGTTVTLCRVGSQIRSLYNGVVLHETSRPDLAGPAMVGPMAYAVTGVANIVGTFDDVDFTSITDMADCGG